MGNKNFHIDYIKVIVSIYLYRKNYDAFNKYKNVEFILSLIDNTNLTF